MNRRTFLILIVAIIVLGTLVLAGRDRGESAADRLLMPELSEIINDIKGLTVTDGDGNVTTLRRGSTRWTVAERADYPADIGRIRRNLIALAEARVIEEKTADPARYPKLGVADITDEGAAGIELALDLPGGPQRIIVGKTGVRGENAYVRRSGEAVSLLVSAPLDLGADPADWLDRALIDVPTRDVFRVTTTHPDGETVRIEKADRDADSFELADLPADATLAYAGVTGSIGAVLTGLECDDVTPRTPGTDANGAAQTVTRFEMFDGLVVTARIVSADDQARVAFDVSYDATLAARFVPPTTDPAAAENAEAPGSAATNSPGVRAADLDRRLDGWWFVLPDYKLEQLTRRRADLLQP